MTAASSQQPGSAGPPAGRPERVIHGRSMLADSLFVVEASYLRALAEEVAAVRACTRVEQAARLAPTLRLTSVPGLDPDEPVQEDGPYDWSETSKAADGDWPPALAQLTLAVFPPEDCDAWAALIDRVGARIERTVLNGDLLLIPVEREDALLRVLEELGIEADAVRDGAIAAVFEDLGAPSEEPANR